MCSVVSLYVVAVDETEWHDTAARNVPLEPSPDDRNIISDGMVAGRNKHELRHFLNEKFHLNYISIEPEPVCDSDL